MKLRRALQLSWLLVLVLVAMPAPMARAAGMQLVTVPAGAGGPAMQGAVWYPCNAPASPLHIGLMLLMAAKDCPVAGSHLPLVVISHGYSGKYTSHHDTAETLANAGFVVAAINHPIDSGPDMRRADSVAMFTERPNDIKRLIDYMLEQWPEHAKIDAASIGFFGFSRGGYTGLVLIGANPDLRAGLVLCAHESRPPCEQIRANVGLPTSYSHDPRIKAAAIADPAFGPTFTRASLSGISVPVQLWASQLSGEDKGIGVRPEYVESVRDNLPNRPEFHLVPKAGHYAFLTPCTSELAERFPLICTDHPGFDRVAFHQQMNADILAFFRKHLRVDRPKAG